MFLGEETSPTFDDSLRSPRSQRNIYILLAIIGHGKAFYAVGIVREANPISRLNAPRKILLGKIRHFSPKRNRRVIYKILTSCRPLRDDNFKGASTSKICWASSTVHHTRSSAGSAHALQVLENRVASLTVLKSRTHFSISRERNAFEHASWPLRFASGFITGILGEGRS